MNLEQRVKDLEEDMDAVNEILGYAKEIAEMQLSMILRLTESVKSLSDVLKMHTSDPEIHLTYDEIEQIPM